MQKPDKTLRKLRRFCLSLPETSEVQSWGHPNFQAGRRTFAVFEYYRDIPSIAVKLDIAEAGSLLQDSRFYRTPYVGKSGWVSLRVDRPVAWDLIEDLVTKSYRSVALKRMIAALDRRRQ